MGGLISTQQALSSQIFEKRSAREEALSHARFLTLRAEEALARVATLEKRLVTLRADETTSRAELEKISRQIDRSRGRCSVAKGKSVSAAAAQESAQRDYEAALNDEVELRSSATVQEGRRTALQAKLSALELESHGLQAQMGPINSQREALRADETRLKSEFDQAGSRTTVAEESLRRAELMLGAALMQQQTLRAAGNRTKGNLRPNTARASATDGGEKPARRVKPPLRRF